MSSTKTTFITFPHSGPRSCLCSKTELCSVSEDNEVEVFLNILQVTEILGLLLVITEVKLSSTKCDVMLQESGYQELCAANQDCAYYTW